MVQLLSLTLFVAAVAAIAVPGDEWKNQYKCPAPVTKTVYVPKVEYKVEYKDKYVTKTEYKTEYVTKTEYKKEYITAAPVYKTEKEYVYVTKECGKGWGDHN